MNHRLLSVVLAWLACAGMAAAQEVRLTLTPSMLQSSSPLADFSGLVDEQDIAPGATTAAPKQGWVVPSQHWKEFPFAVTLNLGRPRNLSTLWFFDTNGKGDWTVAIGEPWKWQAIATNDCDSYLR